MKPKRLILSRKGFDSTLKGGRGYSPIFPDGTMFSLPIPEDEEGEREVDLSSCDYKTTYGDLWHGELNMGEVLEDLTRRKAEEKGKLRKTYRPHFDPDINHSALHHRLKDWRGLLGQAGGPQGHLKGNVEEGDLFLFFGIYQQIERDKEQRWRYVPQARQRHVLWGWLQIERIRTIGNNETTTQLSKRLQGAERNWINLHPHLQRGWWYGENTVYIASEMLSLGDGLKAPGAGVFRNYDQNLLLTNPKGSGRATDWRLPPWFYPKGNKKPLTNHPKHLWKPGKNHAYVERIGNGQEFVLHLEDYPKALPWVSGLIGDSARPETCPILETS